MPELQHRSIGSGTWIWRLRPYVSPVFLSWVIVVVLALMLFWPSTVSLLSAWESRSDDTYGHGYLIAAICFWLAWRRIHLLQSESVSPSLIAGLFLGAVGFVWLIALRGGVQTLHQVLLPTLIFLSIFAVLGRQIALCSWIAVGYLIFAIDVWSVGNGLLQQATVVATDFLLRATGVTASVNGNLITVPSGIFEVAGGCSGLRYFLVALALGTLYGEVHHCSLKNRIRLILLAVALALCANWLRVYVIVLAGYLTDMQHYLIRVEHARFGWFVFAVMIVPLFILGRRWIEPPTVQHVACAAAKTRSSIKVVAGIAVAVIGMSIAPLFNVLVPLRASQMAFRPLPDVVQGWVGPAISETPVWKPVFTGADSVARGNYMSGGREVELFTAVYASQSQGKELIGYRNSIAGEELEVLAKAQIDSRKPLNELLVEHTTGRSLIWYFYEIGELHTNRALTAQLSYGLASVFGSPISRIIALRARCSADCESAREDLHAFLVAIQKTPDAVREPSLYQPS